MLRLIKESAYWLVVDPSAAVQLVVVQLVLGCGLVSACFEE